MQIRYSYRLTDFEDVGLASDRLHPRLRYTRGALIIAGVVTLLAPFLTASGPNYPNQFLLGTTPIGIFLILRGLRNSRQLAKRLYAKAIDGVEHEAEINENGITISSPNSRLELQWPVFSQAIEAATVVALVINTIMYVIPKRAFSTEQWAEFLELAKKNIPVWDAEVRTIRLI